MNSSPSFTDSFPAMGSVCDVTIVGGRHTRLAELARARMAGLESRWSRFLHDSEISRLNAGDGSAQRVSRDTLLLIDHAVAAWRLSGGNFDPTVCEIMNRSGYDRSFTELTAGKGTVVVPPTVETPARRSPGCRGIALDHDASAVTFSDGVMFDPGGIGKGLAADLVVDTLLESGADGACVNVGGDLRVGGRAPDGADAWRVGLANPFDTEDLIAVVALTDQGMSTSNRLIRTWRQGDSVRNHLVRPSTGASADGLVSATVIARTGWWSEVLTKVAMLQHTRDPIRLARSIERLGGEGLFVSADRTVLTTARFTRFDAMSYATAAT